jgi:hypothetical protein
MDIGPSGRRSDLSCTTVPYPKMMLAEWNAECSQDASTLMVPWTDEAGGSRFVDLRASPYDIAEISEAEHNPTLGRALRSLNASRSPVLTAKCDAWSLTQEGYGEQMQTLRMELMLPEEDITCGYSSYIDVMWRESAVFVSMHKQQERLDRIVRRAKMLDHPECALECVLRPAFIDLNGPLEGYAISVYVTSLGRDKATAFRRWECALEDVVTLLRSKEMEVARGSATIDAAAGSSAGAGE